MNHSNRFRQNHLDELTASGIDPAIADLNFWSVEDPEEVDRLLSRNASRRWKHSEDLVPGWAVTGVDPETGERDFSGIQFKPDKPRPQTEKDGTPKLSSDGTPKVRKYESASGYPAEPLFLGTEEGGYWQRILSDRSIPLLITEGSKKAGSGLSHGFCTVSIPGVTCGQKLGRLKSKIEKFCGVGRTVYLAFDSDLHDNPNVCKALENLGRLMSAAGVLVKIALWQEGQGKGLDDFLVAQGKEAFAEILDNAPTLEEWRKASEGTYKPQHQEDPAVEFLQRACKALYCDSPWICFGGTLYQWNGTYYKETPDQAEYPRVRAFCNSFEVLKTVKEETFSTYPFAKPRSVKEVLEWQKQACTVLAEQVNPPGINCTNGTLELHWEGKTLVPKLTPHSPDRCYLSEPKVTYDPGADPSEYERLMQCLDSASREIWEKTIAAALDLATVRKFKGRCVRALFLKGDGANGKDTLRGLVQELFGTGAIASCSVTDFAQYDSGTYFKVYLLRGKRINWPSENADAGRVDQLRGLRAAITGDPLTFEAKHRQGIQEPCSAVFLFNINEAPTLVTTLKASASRWGVVPFGKTYSESPGTGELRADPRFKEDPLFVQKKILPAFLNQLLKQLQAVVLEGVDYTPTQNLLDEIQRESSHLLQFCQDTGLSADPEGSVSVADLWSRLKQWYIETGTLIIETTSTGKEKLSWVDQVRRGDRNVKGPNQVIQRFAGLFPKARRTTHRPKGVNNPEVKLTGICFAKTDQRDQRESLEFPQEKGLNPSTQQENWVETDQREGQTDQRELSAPSQLVTQLTNSRYPVENVKPLQEKVSVAHVGHVTQFEEKNFSEIVEVAKAARRGRFNPASRKMETQWVVMMSNGTRQTVFRDQIPPQLLAEFEARAS